MGFQAPLVMPELIPLFCDSCGLSDRTLMKCGRCNVVAYCNKECQIQGWQNGHKNRCVLANEPRYSSHPPPKLSSSTYTKKPNCLSPSFSELPHEGIDVVSVLKDLLQLNISRGNDKEVSDNITTIEKNKKNKKNTANDINITDVAIDTAIATMVTVTATNGVDNKKQHKHFNVPGNGCRYCKQSEFFPLIRTLVLGLSEQAGLNYVLYKSLADKYYERIPENLKVSFAFECHRWATIRFGWSLLSETNALEIMKLTLSKFVDCKRIVSMGSGCGYAEHMLFNAAKKLGKHIDIFAYDLNSPKTRGNFDVKVRVGGVNKFREIAPLDDTVLLLCWPPFGSRMEEQSRMGFDTLTLFAELGGRYFIYIGDFDATGDWRFHNLLTKEWCVYQEIFNFTPIENWIPEKMALSKADNDSIGVYYKK